MLRKDKRLRRSYCPTKDVYTSTVCEKDNRGGENEEKIQSNPRPFGRQSGTWIEVTKYLQDVNKRTSYGGQNYTTETDFGSSTLNICTM